jgi:hypothetical protein
MHAAGVSCPRPFGLLEVEGGWLLLIEPRLCLMSIPPPVLVKLLQSAHSTALTPATCNPLVAGVVMQRHSCTIWVTIASCVACRMLCVLA